MGAHPYTPRESLRGKLKHAKASGLDHVLAFVPSEDEPARITVTHNRQWMQRVLSTLAELAWESIELRDKKGGMLGRHNRGPEDEPPPGELESLAPSKAVAETHGMLQLMLRAQDLALTRMMATMGPVLETLFKLVDVSMKRLDLTEKQYEHAIKVNSRMADDLARATMRQLARTTSAGDDDEDSEAGNALAPMWPAIIQSMMSPEDGRDERPRKKKPRSSSTERGKRKPNGVRNGASSERPERDDSSPTE